MTRLERLGERLGEPLLVTYPANVRYLLGFESSNAAVLVEPGGEATLYTDFRYIDAAEALAGVSAVQTRRDLISEIADRLGGRRIGFEAARLTYEQWETLVAGNIDLVPTRSVVERLREVKDDAEIAAIRRAVALSDKVYEALASERFSRRTEAELAWWIERAFHDLGAQGVSFPPIVAGGVNGARPHHHPGTDLIPSDTLVTVDIGCILDGYCSDCTRTFATGEIPQQLADAYALCARAQLDGLAAVRAGQTGRDADAASRTAISEAGLAEAYGHGLGHGVGLEVHEGPVLRKESTDVLVACNVVSVEPGLYLSDVGGVRIEDLVVVTDDGCDVLTRFTKELLTVE